MPLNKNSTILELLSWHGQDRGGIRVPFQNIAGPLGITIETDLILRLRKLAKLVANGEKGPRFVFLVGGPGNGKSETVEDFLRTLDTELKLDGALTTILTSSFSPQPLVPRRVEILPDKLPDSASFKNRVGRLVVIQDATATDSPNGDAARALADDVADLLTSNENPLPMFVVCANRGLLARALREASREYGPTQDVTKLLVSAIKATSLGTEALASKRIACWPLPEFENVACWPLDLDTLIKDDQLKTSSMWQILEAATTSSRWEVTGRCLDCASALNCPFQLNAQMLRDDGRRQALLQILRKGELATGQRWNFRDAFSLTAELVVGQWSDFHGSAHPCDWVHKNVEHFQSETEDALVANQRLMARLYVHSLFPRNLVRSALEQIGLPSFDGKPLSKLVVETFGHHRPSSSKHIRRILAEQYSSLDPAIYTPRDPNDVLKKIEDSYNQSVTTGNGEPVFGQLGHLEQRFLVALSQAEEEWDVLGRASNQAVTVISILRRIGAGLCKRSVGVSGGRHACEDYLKDYLSALRDQDLLDTLKGQLQVLLGRQQFRFDAVESFGQPQEERGATFTLTGPPPGIRSHPAPVSTDDMPGHDVPSFEFPVTRDRIPITFEFYLALRLREERCVNSSLPASVRAAVDRIRHRYAGVLCRDVEKFADGTATLLVGDEHRVTVSADGSTKIGKIPAQQGGQ